MNEKPRLRLFIKENTACLIIAFVGMILLHASSLIGKAIGIDTEALLYYGDDFYKGWLNSGRQGLVLLHKLLYFWCDGFNHIAAGIYTIIFLMVALTAWIYLFRVVSNKENKLGNIVFCLIIISHTILTEQVYFRIQSAEVCLSFAFVAISILLLVDVVTKNKIGMPDIFKVIIIVFLNLISFSIYQIMVPLYIFGCVAVLLLRFSFVNREMKPWTESVKMAVVFLISFIVNEVITLSFFNGSEYLGNQIYWKTESFGKCIYQIISHVVRAGVIGRRIYFAPTYAVYAILLAITFLMLAKQNKYKKDGIVFLVIVLIFTVGAPFYMTVLCGGESVIRSQLLLPFTLGFMAYALMFVLTNTDIISNKCNPKLAKGIILLIIAINIITITQQAILSIRLHYTDKIRYTYDEAFAYELIDEINKFQNEDKSLPVVFIGSRSSQLDSFCIDDGDVIGYSFFDWDTNSEPYSYHSSLRIIGFLSALGTTYTEPDTAKMDSAYDYSLSMNTYPVSGGIVVYDGMIIVKLSDRQ